jgi:hypothetical protein
MSESGYAAEGAIGDRSQGIVAVEKHFRDYRFVRDLGRDDAAII